MVTPDHGPLRRWHLQFPAAFALAATAGGATSGLALAVLSGLFSWAPTRVALWICLAVALILLLVDYGLLHVDLPSVRRQVPQTVMRHRLWGSARFGFEMGTGIRTHSAAGTPLLLAMLIVFTRPGLANSILVGLLFGVGRGWVPLSRLFSGDRSRWSTRLEIAGSRELYARLIAPAGVLVTLQLILGGME